MPPSSYQTSFEFLDMSSCDETQKLKLKNTLEMPLFSAVTSMPPRERSNFVTRNSSVKPQQYHLNNFIKSQKPNYQSISTKRLNVLEHHGSFSTRSFSTEANSFSSNYDIPTNITDNRHYSNTQDKINKWQTCNKKSSIGKKC